MNFLHAFGFLVTGVISGLLPRWFPGLCEATGVDGSSTRELWLQVMSFVQVSLAGYYFLYRVCAWLGEVMPFTPALDETVAPLPRPAVAARVAAPAWRRVSTGQTRVRPAILPLPVAAFDAGLLDQRRAA